ncbi:MAG: sensor histidine kinase, partial [Bacteroidota bacterium]
FWYSVLLFVSLSVLAGYIYISVKESIYSDLDSSLKKVTNSLDHLKSVNKKNDDHSGFSHDSIVRGDARDFSGDSGLFAEYRSKSLNTLPESRDTALKSLLFMKFKNIFPDSRNYFIQVADTNNRIIWRSLNLNNNKLPMLSNKVNLINKRPDKPEIGDSGFIVSEKIKGMPGDSVFITMPGGDSKIRLYSKRTKNGVFTVAYSLRDIEATLSELRNKIYIAFPFVFLISLAGGIVLAGLFLRPIGEIARTAESITASNLSRRIPKAGASDEISKLINTLNQMIERLEKSFQQIRQFTSDASHELKTPLTILQGELAMALQKDYSKEDYLSIMASSLDEVIRLTNVVETLLELSRAETGQIQMNFREENVSRLVSGIAEDAEILAEAKSISVRSNIMPGVSAEIDSARVHQAVLNIVDNAVKYTPVNGKIDISLNGTDEYVEIKVSDSGPGIPEDKLPYIFDRFYRLDKARTSNIQGTGLGLSIVSWIVDAHEGDVIVEPGNDGGSTFTVRLPISRNSR